MRSALITVLFAWLLIPAQAETIEVTATGTITSVEGTALDSSVHVGTAYSETFLINSATPTTPDGGYYVDDTGGGTITFGDYTTSSASSSIASILSNLDGGGLYGYNLSTFYKASIPAQPPPPGNNSSISNSVGFPLSESTLILNSLNMPAVAPTTSLSSIQEFPISDFGLYSGVLFYVGSSGYPDFKADITSYTVTTIAVPEPSSYALALLSLLAMGLKLSIRLRQSKKSGILPAT